MFWFVATLLGFGITAAIGIFADFDYKKPAIATLLVLLSLGLLADSTTSVSARTVGVETSLGKPVGALDNGFHWVRPWASVDDSWDATVQTDSYKPVIRLANGTTAPLDVRVQYQIDAGPKFLPLWNQYKDFDKIRTNVVELNTTTALNEVFEAFNPLTTIDGSGTQTVTVSSFSPQVLAAVRAQMPEGLTILKIVIPSIQYNDVVQQQIDNIIIAAAQTRVALQNEKTDEAVAAGNNLLSKGSLDPHVLYQGCLNMMNTWMKANDPVPPAWSCGAPNASYYVSGK
jgi:hypothetical protein